MAGKMYFEPLTKKSVFTFGKNKKIKSQVFGVESLNFNIILENFSLNFAIKFKCSVLRREVFKLPRNKFDKKDVWAMKEVIYVKNCS